jgi:DNA-binding transcriptional ArsR family regulator
VHRIHFTADDLARIRHIPTLGPMAESVLSLSVLRGRHDGPLFSGFREQVRTVIDVRYDVVLNAISPHNGSYFDVISLAEQFGSFEQTTEALMATSREHMRGELAAFARQHGGQLQPVLRDLPENPDARRTMINSLARYHDAVIAPRWSSIRTQLEADRHARSQIVLDRGVDGLLATLHPNLRWEPPHLIDAGKPEFADEIHLGGKGLLLAPSFFWRTPGYLKPVDPAQQGILVYPAPLDPVTRAAGEPDQSLANLLGRTRATVLRAISDGTATTSQLASRVGTSTASISQHTSVLREAGLITSHRYRNTVHHMLAAAGAVLLNGSN